MSVEKEEAINPFEEEGFSEKLAREGRIPIFMKVSVGSKIIGSDKDGHPIYEQGSHLQPVVFCFIPPEGARKDDSFKGSTSLGFEFFSPTGKSRGCATMYVLLPDQAVAAKQQIIEKSTR